MELRDALDRVRAMANGSETWDLSPKDIGALTLLVREYDKASSDREKLSVEAAQVAERYALLCSERDRAVEEVGKLRVAVLSWCQWWQRCKDSAIVGERPTQAILQSAKAAP